MASHTTTTFYDMPFDIQEKIYKMKHKLEMEDVLGELCYVIGEIDKCSQCETYMHIVDDEKYVLKNNMFSQFVGLFWLLFIFLLLWRR